MFIDEIREIWAFAVAPKRSMSARSALSEGHDAPERGRTVIEAPYHTPRSLPIYPFLDAYCALLSNQGRPLANDGPRLHARNLCAGFMMTRKDGRRFWAKDQIR
jgi:hypothetical protein